MTSETIVVALLMAVLGGGCLFMTLLTLPGNWAMLVLVGAAQLWSLAGNGAPLYSGWTLLALFLLAVFGEVCETAMSAAGARGGGARARGAWGAILGSFAGALVGTVLLAFIPLAGTLAGALIGAAVGAFIGEMTYGDRSAMGLVLPAAAAAAGRMVGVLVKVGFGIAIWIIAVAGALWN
jgi:hypothetical protein